MSWREFLVSKFDDCHFSDPVDPARISAVEAAIGAEFPLELRSLLLETDGFAADHHSLMVFGVRTGQPEDFIPVHDELNNTPEHKDLYASFEGLLFLASDSTGG
jgi:hypothetical protein